jgi:hypothetical protein
MTTEKTTTNNPTVQVMELVSQCDKAIRREQNRPRCRFHFRKLAMRCRRDCRFENHAPRRPRKNSACIQQFWLQAHRDILFIVLAIWWVPQKRVTTMASMYQMLPTKPQIVCVSDHRRS